MDIAYHFFELSKGVLHFANLTLNLLLLGLIIGGLQLDRVGLVDNDGSVLLDAFLVRLLLAHFGGDDRKFLPRAFDHHLRLLYDFLHLGLVDLLLLVLFLQLLDLLARVVDLLRLRLYRTLELLYCAFLLHYVYLQLPPHYLLAADRVFY